MLPNKKPKVEVTGPIVLGISLTEKKAEQDGRYRVRYVRTRGSESPHSGIYLRTNRKTDDERQ